MVSKSLLTSNKDDWETPQWLFDELNKIFYFDIDLCATEINKKCKAYCPDIFQYEPYTMRNGFMNPPYGRRIRKYIERAWELSKKMLIVCLLPARTDTKWWSIFWDREQQRPRQGCQVRFLEGRLKFSDSKESAPFPSAIVILNRVNNNDR